MALVKCPECGKMVSPNAVKCPQCGAPVKELLTKQTLAAATNAQPAHQNRPSNVATPPAMQERPSNVAPQPTPPIRNEEATPKTAMPEQMTPSAVPTVKESKPTPNTQDPDTFATEQQISPTEKNKQVSTNEDNNHTAGDNASKKSSLGLILLIAGLLLVAGGVGFWFYRVNVYLPAKRDAEAPRYYVMAQNLNMRSTPEFEAEYNKIGSFPYGTEILVYDSVKSGIKPYVYGKYAPVDARGKVMKDKCIEGYLSYNFMLNKADFFLLNSIFGNEDARKMLAEARYKRALLRYFKDNHMRGDISGEKIAEYGIDNSLATAERWQVSCRYEKAKSNTVYRSRKYRKDSKFTDLAVIIKNIDSGERKLLYFVFEDDESFRLLSEQYAPRNGYMKDRTLKLKQYNDGTYYVEVDYEDEF